MKLAILTPVRAQPNKVLGTAPHIVVRRMPCPRNYCKISFTLKSVAERCSRQGNRVNFVEREGVYMKAFLLCVLLLVIPMSILNPLGRPAFLGYYAGVIATWAIYAIVLRRNPEGSGVPR